MRAKKIALLYFWNIREMAKLKSPLFGLFRYTDPPSEKYFFTFSSDIFL